MEHRARRWAGQGKVLKPLGLSSATFSPWNAKMGKGVRIGLYGHLVGAACA